MVRFQCEKCGIIFENGGQVLEYSSPVYGPCCKKVANCPECGISSDEYRSPKQFKANDNPGPAMRGCPAGGCCCSG